MMRSLDSGRRRGVYVLCILCAHDVDVVYERVYRLMDYELCSNYLNACFCLALDFPCPVLLHNPSFRKLCPSVDSSFLR